MMVSPGKLFTTYLLTNKCILAPAPDLWSKNLKRLFGPFSITLEYKLCRTQELKGRTP